MGSTTDQFLTVPSAAKELGKTKVTLYRWIAQNTLFAVKFGGILFVPITEVERLKNLTAEAVSLKREGDAGATTASQKESKG